jgi:hypothetical protein
MSLAHLSRIRPKKGVIFAIVVCTLVVLACTPGPKHQACVTDDECKDALGKAAYCMRSRCVECVSHATCGVGRRWVDGACAGT